MPRIYQHTNRKNSKVWTRRPGIGWNKLSTLGQRTKSEKKIIELFLGGECKTKKRGTKSKTLFGTLPLDHI